MGDNKFVTGTVVSTGGALAFFSKLELSDWSYIVGIFVALVGLAGGFYWQYRKDKRDRIIMEATLEALRTKGVNLHDDE